MFFSACSQAIVTYLDNGTIKIGIDLAMGGSITYLSLSGTNDNLVNNYDLGRQIQQSYYSGPYPYNPNNSVHPSWTNWPWNPIQSGDVYNNRSSIITYTNDGQRLYVKSRPMQWALNNVPGECTFESWISLTGNVAVVSNRLLNARTDTTEQFLARGQELPAVYTIGRLYRLVSYTNTAPFTGGAVAELPRVPPPWQYWRATESWAALLNSSGWGVGVYHPGAILFAGGFSGTPGSGGPNNNATGYMTPLHVEIIDGNIEYKYSYNLILGTLTQIRDWVYAQSYRPGCDFSFRSDRQHWSYPNVKDSGWPLQNNRLQISLYGTDPQIQSPLCAFAASNVPKLYIRAAYHIANPAGRSTGQIFWEVNGGGYSGANSKTFAIVADGQFRTYEVNLASSTNYNGLITNLRFDPAYSGESNDYVEVAAISSSPFVNNSLTTNPVLRFSISNLSPVVSFQSVSATNAGFTGKNLRYDLESRSSLVSGSWQYVVGATNVTGTGFPIALSGTNYPSLNSRFFRLKLRLDP
jgi:hypothetical protein